MGTKLSDEPVMRLIAFYATGIVMGSADNNIGDWKCRTVGGSICTVATEDEARDWLRARGGAVILIDDELKQ